MGDSEGDEQSWSKRQPEIGRAVGSRSLLAWVTSRSVSSIIHDSKISPTADLRRLYQHLGLYDFVRNETENPGNIRDID
jgi:hypothetical protein